MFTKEAFLIAHLTPRIKKGPLLFMAHPEVRPINF